MKNEKAPKFPFSNVKAHVHLCVCASAKKNPIITTKIPAPAIVSCLWLFWHNITCFNLGKWNQRSHFNSSQHRGESHLNIYRPLPREHPFVRMFWGCILIFMTTSSSCFCFSHPACQAFTLVPLASYNFKGDFSGLPAFSSCYFHPLTSPGHILYCASHKKINNDS